MPDAIIFCLFLGGMSSELNYGLRRLPARLDSERTAELLGFAAHDIPVLVGCGLLRPLGRPAPNGPKYFALVDVEKVAVDRDWFSRATKAVAGCWAEKNAKQRGRGTTGTAGKC